MAYNLERIAQFVCVYWRRMLLHIFYATLLISAFSLLSVYPTTQDVYWRDYIPGDIPQDAVEGAPGRYIGQVYHGGFIVAHIYPDTQTAVYQFSKKRTTRSHIKILCSRKQNRLYWEKMDFNQPNDQQMKNAVKGGFGIDWDTPLFIGKTVYDGEWKIGIVYEISHPKWAGLWVWNLEGAEIQFKQFYMLKYNPDPISNECHCECDSESSWRNASIRVSLLT